jgi:hypothetical protein
MLIVQSEAEPTPVEVSTLIVVDVSETAVIGPAREIGLD